MEPDNTFTRRAGAVLEGSVAKAGHQVRITAQLINPTQHSYYVAWWELDPELDPLRFAPRFAALPKKVGLEP